MRPAVVTAVLLSMCVLDTVTARPKSLPSCSRFPESPCGDGWSRIDENCCAKFIGSPKTFNEAQQHCRSLNSELVSVNSLQDIMQLLCLTWRAGSDRPDVWTGVSRSEGRLRNSDGSEFKYARWFPRQPKNSDGQQECFELIFSKRSHFEATSCSEENYFLCARKM